MSETAALIAEFQLGLDCEDFWRSSVGRYVLGCAKQDIEAGLEKLKEADPEDAKSIRAAQFEIRVAEAAPRWLNEAIIRGRQAETIANGE